MKHRYAEGSLLPPYSYLPGKSLHPNHPDGYRSRFPVPTHFGPDEFGYALDLLNHGFPWESHVFWEAFWNLESRQGNAARVYQVLIFICAAEIKLRSGAEDAGQRLLDKVGRELKTLMKEPESIAVGVDLKELDREVTLRAAGMSRGIQIAWS